MSRLKHITYNLLNRSLKIKIFQGQSFEPSCDDVFLVSYPKSGNTWLRFLIGNYLSGNRCDFTNSHLFVPDIHFNPDQCRKIEPPRIIKSHLSFTSDYKKVVYLLRDGRDVAVSYYFHCVKYGKIKPGMTFDGFVRLFNNGSIDKFSTWSDHVNTWLDGKPENLMILKYEQLFNNPLENLIRILRFAGLPIDSDAVASAVNSSRFENMKKLEKSQHELTSLLKKSNKNISFVRSGKIGEWKSFFTDSLNEEFIAAHGSALQRVGYL